MRRRRRLALAALIPSGLAAQQLFDSSPGSSLLFHSNDQAILSGSTNRRDLDCRVEPLRPRLGFDLKYTAGYAVHLPADAVETEGDRLRVLFRIRPNKGESVHFRQELTIAPKSSAGGGTATFPARYVLGPGRYKVDWMMRNRRGHVCSAHWETRAPAPGHAGRLAAAAVANLIAPYRMDLFAAEPPVVRTKGVGGGMHIAVLLNLAPQERKRFKLNDYELESVVGMLRALHREPEIGLFSLTAFSVIDRQIVYTSKRQTRLDFEALGEAIDSMSKGVIDIGDLADAEGESLFLADILNDATRSVEQPPDAVVILGPKVDREAQLREGMLKRAPEPPPLFQFAFNPNPQSYPWPGAIELALQPHGLTVYDVTLPQEFSRSLEGMLAAITGEAPLQPRL